jgi:hypothetical protein
MDAHLIPRPVTPGVAGSSPVHSAKNQFDKIPEETKKSYYAR